MEKLIKMVTVYTKDNLKDLAGEVLKDQEQKPVTLGKVFVNALLNNIPEESDISSDEKLRRFKLAQRFYSEETVNLTSEEVVLMRQLISKNYGVLVTGQILDWLK